MLTRARNELLPSTLTIIGQGETATLDVTYYNRKQTELNAILEDPEKSFIDAFLFVVKDWDSEYELSADGLAEAEDDRPGIVMAVIAGFHEARKVGKQKN